jgi:hypothetical protein
MHSWSCSRHSGKSVIQRCAILAALALIGASLLAQPARASNIAKLGRECREGKQKACEELTKIATESKNANSREEAVQFITDQSLLVRIAVQDQNLAVRRAAVSVMNGPSALEFLKTFSAEASEDGIVANEALEKLQDPSLEFQAALDCKSPKLRLQATDALTDQSLLSRLALQSTDAAVESEALNKLTDQKAIEMVATGAKIAAVRSAALWKLTDSSVIGLIAKNDADASVRDAAKAALDWKTAQSEHEVYVWKAPAPNSNDASLPRWRISGILGSANQSEQIVSVVQKTFGDKAFAGNTDSSVAPSASSARIRTSGLAESTFGDGALAIRMISSAVGANSLLEEMINSEGTGYVSWWFEPENDKDACLLESGTIPPGMNVALTAAKAQLQFNGVFANGKGVWAVGGGSAFLFFQPKLHINANGKLAMAGSVATFSYVSGTPGHLTVGASTLQDAAVVVVGTIRFPQNKWTLAGAGYELQDGGLQFDETGVFLMVGTKYRKHPQ